MKVKKLEWVNKDTFLGSTNGLYVIQSPRITLINHVKYFNGSTEEAKHICQKHFEKFILASIEVENEG